jgi:MFS family permease
MSEPPQPDNTDKSSDSAIAYEPPDQERSATAAPTEGELERELPTVGALDRSPPPPAHDPYAAWRVPVFRLFIGNYWLAVIGSQAMAVAVQWDLAMRTKSALMMGFLGGVQALPVILLALLAGHASDVFSRKRVLMVTQVVLVICPLALAMLVARAGRIDQKQYLWVMFGIVLVNAIALTFARPARQAMLPQLVPKGIFSNAVTWNSTLFELATILGPLIGAVVIARWNIVAALIFSAVCTIVCLWLTYLLPPLPAANRGEPMNFKNLLAGVRFVFDHKILLGVMTLDLFAVLFGGATFVLPLFATERLHVGSVGFGLLKAASSIGAVGMAVFIAHLPPMQRAGRAMLLAVAGFGAATIVFGLSTSFWLSFVMLLLTGAFDNVSVVVRHTLVQLLTPDAMRGRVSAVNQVFIGASNELGGFESGMAAAAMGLAASVVFGGIGTIVVVLAVAAAWPQVRKFGALQSAETA